MRRGLGFVLCVVASLFAGCDERLAGYVAASSITEEGFARDAKELREADGREIKLWGFLDQRNIYGDGSAREILQEWWSGDGPDAATWRFDLKAQENDEAGHSFAVRVPNDAGRDRLLEMFVADARARRPTRVFVQGRVFAFDAPTNVVTRTGLYMRLQSSQDILLRLPEENR